MATHVSVALSGERFRVVYQVQGSEAEANALARDICLEQTVEFPADLLPPGDIPDQIVGQIDALEQHAGHWQAVISYAIETTGFELTQLLNVAFGNFSLKPGVRVERLELPPTLLRAFTGPRFGRAGLRERVRVFHRPLLCTALKPMGLSASALAELTYKLASGGIDIIKDDHGLANQPFAPFEERVQRCAEAVARANGETGLACIYVPNVTADPISTLERALFAKTAGVGGLSTLR